MNTEILAELEALKEKDVSTRQKLLSDGELYNGYSEEMQSVHIENANKLNEIIDKHGWPGKSLVGLEGSRIAWLIAQHSICTPNLQRKFLSKIDEAYQDDEVPKKQYVLLQDRVLAQEGKPQKCGWVFDWQPDGEIGCVVEDLSKANALRKELNMPCFEDALKDHRESVKKEGGKMPGSYTEYRAQVSSWQKQVGWE